MTVKHYDWSAYHANVRPNKVAIRDLSSNKELTYSELNNRANNYETLPNSGSETGTHKRPKKFKLSVQIR